VVWQLEKTLVGIRAYLVGENAREHEEQLAGIRDAFPKGEAFLLYLACGLKPTEGMARLADRVEYYGDAPKGVGLPTQKIIEYALANGFARLVVVDGDGQHKPEAVAAMASRLGEKGADAVVPQRSKRVIFSREKLDGKTVEDVESAFLRMGWGAELKGLADLTPGLFLFRDAGKLAGFNAEENSWIGDYLLVEHCLKKKMSLTAPVIKIRENVYTLSNKRLLFREIAQLETHYGKTLQEVAVEIRKRPYDYLHGGSIGAIDGLIDEYRRFKYTERISGVKALILAGGRGTRLKPLTDTIQKQVFPIANKPLLRFIMETITRTGISEIGVIVGPKKEQIMAALGDGSDWNAKITYIEQDAPAGLAHAVLCAKGFLGESPFLMYLGDNLIEEDLTDFLFDFLESGNCSIMLTRVSDPSRFGIAELDPAGAIKRLVEKPKQTDSNLGIIGIYAFNPSVFGAIAKIKPSARGELEITDAIQKLLESGERVDYRVISGWWKDTGSIESVLDANALMLAQAEQGEGKFEKDDKTVIKGKACIGKGCRLSNSVILGPVSIGENTVITDSIIGPYTTLGANNKVKGCSITYSLTLDGVSLSDLREVYESVIGKYATVTGRQPSKRTVIVAGEGEKISA